MLSARSRGISGCGVGGCAQWGAGPRPGSNLFLDSWPQGTLTCHTFPQDCYILFLGFTSWVTQSSLINLLTPAAWEVRISPSVYRWGLTGGEARRVPGGHTARKGQRSDKSQLLTPEFPPARRGRAQPGVLMRTWHMGRASRGRRTPGPTPRLQPEPKACTRPGGPGVQGGNGPGRAPASCPARGQHLRQTDSECLLNVE